MGLRFARKHARGRYGPDKVEKNDMLGVFVRQGMSQSEAERTGILQLYGFIFYINYNPPLEQLS